MIGPSRILPLALCLAVSAVLPSCATRLGPASIKQAHRPYNDSVIETLNEQLLLNLVRLRYRDNPYFIEVSSITAQQSFEGSLGAAGRVPFLGNRLRDIGGAAGVTYTDNPTITFQPLQGEDFLNKLMAPIPLEAMLRLTQSGWSMSRVFRIAVERANELPNAPTASGPTPDGPPEYEGFQEAAHEFRRLQQTHGLGLALDGDRIALAFDRSRIPVSDCGPLRSRLAVSTRGDVVYLTARPSLRRSPDEIYLQSRSLKGVLFFLSHNVEVPEGDRRKGLVTTTRNPDGSEFDWDLVSGDLLKVRHSATPPADAFVRVKYRNAWFYIADNDLDSKSTFMLLNQLFNLLAGDVQKVAPVLTIPLG